MEKKENKSGGRCKRSDRWKYAEGMGIGNFWNGEECSLKGKAKKVEKKKKKKEVG